MKNNSKWLLNTFKVILSILWYANIVLIVIAFSMLTWKFITSNTIDLSIPVKYPLKAEIIKLAPVAPNIGPITFKSDQGLLNMKVKNTVGQMAMAYFFLISLEILVMTILYQLRKLLESIKQNLPFKYDNVRRLRITALCFASLTPLNILQGLSTSMLLRAYVKDYGQMVWSESFIGLILGIVIYIMADIFKYGFELQKENGEFV
ncbi:MAG: DUF2975 domain-containing protein [Mucilaginibacter sp.]|uniref:DUF2975 domain-containing protein n=1 Tax=Mucilaginibacter sp. TaxID=1882438 RepID=UPI0031AB2D89